MMKTDSIDTVLTRIAENLSKLSFKIRYQRPLIMKFCSKRLLTHPSFIKVKKGIQIEEHIFLSSMKNNFLSNKT